MALASRIDSKKVDTRIWAYEKARAVLVETTADRVHPTDEVIRALADIIFEWAVQDPR